MIVCVFFFFFQAEDGIRDYKVTGVQTCALPICGARPKTACRASYSILPADDPRHCSHRSDADASAQIGGEFSFDARRACGGAASRDQRLFVFHGVAPPTHCRTCARMVSRTAADGSSYTLN